MTPPLNPDFMSPTGQRVMPVAQDPPPTMRADLLPDEFRDYCRFCGEVTIWRMVCMDGRPIHGECTEHTSGSGEKNA